MTGNPENKATLTSQQGNEFSPKVLFFAHLLSHTSRSIVQTDYNPNNSLRDRKRDQGLRKQIQPALQRLNQNPDFTAKISQITEEMLPQTREGTCSIELNSDEKLQLLDLLRINGADITGTRVKKMINGVAF